MSSAPPPPPSTAAPPPPPPPPPSGDPPSPPPTPPTTAAPPGSNPTPQQPQQPKSSSKLESYEQLYKEEEEITKDEEQDDDFDIDKFLEQEASQLSREQEVARVLSAFKLNPYDILDLPPNPELANANAIRKSYRKRSLLIHPDKFSHPRGLEAFDKLKKAEADLNDTEKRKQLDSTISDARMLVLRQLKLPDTTQDDHPKIQNLDPSFDKRVQQKTKEILIDDELRRRRVTKMTMIAEGAEAKRAEDERNEKKRKADAQQKWEDNREERVSGWRAFQKGKRTKKPKMDVLG